MWRLTEPTERLLQQLDELQADSARVGPQQHGDRIIPLFEQIAKRGEAAAIPILARYLFLPPRAVQVAACRAVDHLLASAKSDELLQLYSVVGWRWGWRVSQAWQELSPAQVEALVADDACRASIFGLASFHANGYVRHEAVRLLAELWDGGELPYLLIRQNDWVDPISDDARAAVRDRLADHYLPHFLQCLPLVTRILDFSRHDLTGVVDDVIRMLIHPGHDAFLARAIGSEDRRARRRILNLALEVNGEHRRRVIHYGLKSDDAMLRLRCARKVSSVFVGGALNALMDVLVHDPSMPVRREALQTKAGNSRDAARNVWQDALLDHHVSIRELARFQLDQLGGFDFAQFYRKCLAKDPERVPAISGLGETGDTSDLPAMRGCLGAPLPSRRRAALRAMAKLGGDSVADSLVASLRDESPSVVRESRDALARILPAVRAAQLFSVVEQDRRRRVRMLVLRLVFEMGKWQSLPWLIRTLVHNDGATVEYARGLIEAWFTHPLCNRVFTHPSKSQRAAIARALNEAQEGIEQPFLAKLREWLDDA